MNMFPPCRTSLTLLLLISVPWATDAAPGDAGRGVMVVDFEGGTAPLQSYDGEDFDPDAWEIQSENTYGGSDYALRIWGNSWKELMINPYDLEVGTVFEVAIYSEDRGELQAFAFGDSSENVLFYVVSGEQLVLSDRWNVSYQGAFPQETWHLYRLPVGQDWFDTWGYVPRLNRVIFVNDRDNTHHGVTLFDEVYDVTDEIPIAPAVEIERIVGDVTELSPAAGSDLPRYRMEIAFQSLVYDPDSDTHTYLWDFGDGTTSEDPNPAHDFTATADYTFTVALDVTDEAGLIGRDTCQVSVEPAGQADLISINFTGDVFMGRNYDEPGGLIDTYGVEYLFEPSLGILGEAADVTMINAEVAFTDQGEPHPTKSVVFRTRPQNIVGLTYAGVEIASLGNNHIIDYGLEGLLQTEAMFDSVGIVRGGSGVNDYFATQPCYYTEKGVRMGFIPHCNRTGREYNMQPFLDAGYEKCGFGYWNQPNLERAIAQADSVADIVIAFPHSGEEYYTAPPPRGHVVRTETDPEDWGWSVEPWAGLDHDRDRVPNGFDVEACFPYTPLEQAPDPQFRIWPGMTDRELRWHAVDMGADAVLNSHPHVLQGFEVYDGVLIAHSLGNFMFDLYYPETMPTLVLRAVLDKEGIRRWTYKPAFIDDWIPRPSHGRLGREILDRLADYSRELGAVVGTDHELLTGVIYLDPDAAIPEGTVSEASGAFHEDGGEYLTLPIELAGNGYLSSILDITGVDPAECEVCWGREVLWFGRFEQEEGGHHMWSLNSSGEWLDDQVYFEGAHSLILHREHNAGDNVVTVLRRHLPAADTLRYNINGWMRTENAHDARFMIRFYEDRYTWNQLASVDMGEAVEGTSDWTYFAADCHAPEGARYFNPRCNLDRPGSGDAYAWFDDLRVVEWLPFEPLELPLAVPYPNNYRFVQIRVPTSADSAHVVYEETRLSDGGYASIPDRNDRAPVSVRLSGASPNPFRGETTIRYRLGGAARVDLEIFDLNGRLVEQLARGEVQRPGWHRISWEAPGRAAGVYFARLTVDGTPHARKMVMLR